MTRSTRAYQRRQRTRRLHPHRGGYRVSRFATFAVCIAIVYVAMLVVVALVAMPVT